jgi:hypothetical protein
MSTSHTLATPSSLVIRANIGSSSGLPLSTSRDLQIDAYSGSTGGSVLWQSGVTTASGTAGVYSITLNALNSGTSLINVIQSATVPLWFEVTLDTGAANGTMDSPAVVSPRMQSKGTLYSLSSYTTDRIQNVSVSSSTPSGGDQLVYDGSKWTPSTQGNPKNWIINGNFDVWQRGVTSTTASVYLADRWKSGSVVTSYSRQSSSPPTGSRYYGQFITNASGVLLQQRLESGDAASLSSQTATISFWAKANSGSPTLTPIINTATASDNFSSVNACASSCPSAVTLSTTWTQYSTSFVVPSGATNGLEIQFSGSGAATYSLAQVQLEMGAFKNPFVFESQTEIINKCTRYYTKSNFDAEGILVTNSGSQVNRINVFFPGLMRAAPTVSLTTTGGTASVSVVNVGTNGFTAGMGGVATQVAQFSWTADAEL